MGIKLLLSQELKQEQRLAMRMSHMITLVNLLTVPDQVLTTLINAASFNPDVMESKLQERKRDAASSDDISIKVQSIYPSMIQADVYNSQQNSGIVISPDMRLLENCSDEHQVVITPDVTYIGRKNNKPELVLSEHLKGSPLLLPLIVDNSAYPETSRLISQIRKFDNWKRATLSNAYVFIGEAQREFFENFDHKRLNIFNSDSLATKLNLCTTTISRLLSNRCIEARDLEGSQMFIYAKDLLVTRDKLMRYSFLHSLNGFLANEFEKGKAYSDEAITGMARAAGLKIAIRTVSKYRISSGIPNAAVRNMAYLSGEMTLPYQAVSNF